MIDLVTQNPNRKMIRCRFSEEQKVGFFKEICRVEVGRKLCRAQHQLSEHLLMGKGGITKCTRQRSLGLLISAEW